MFLGSGCTNPKLAPQPLKEELIDLSPYPAVFIALLL